MSKTILALLVLALVIFGRFAIGPANTPKILASITQTTIVEPGGTPDDAKLATSDPDQYAWDLFAYLNRQAKPGVAGIADPSKVPFHEEDDTDSVWETWALASASSVTKDDNKSEVFHYDGSQPVAWDKLNRIHGGRKSLRPGLTGFPGASSTPEVMRVQFPPLPSDGDNQEIRINRYSFDTIVSNHLFSKEGVEAAVLLSKRHGQYGFVSFPAASKEIKAAWIHLRACDNDDACPDKKRYHWRTLNVGAAKQIWGLAAMHIITRDLNNWFWADFDHIDCENRAGACSGYSRWYSSPRSDSTPANSSPKNETQGTRWQYYVLRGTETEFVRNGKDAFLSNPVIEPFQNPSSCMTCHAYASAGLSSAITARSDHSGDPLPNAGQHASVGIPSPSAIFIPAGVAKSSEGASQQLYLQSDFEWSMVIRANSEIAPSSTAVAGPATQTKARFLLTKSTKH